MTLVYGAIMPHPPVIIPGVGSKEEILLLEKTVMSYVKICAKIAALQPELIVLVSPHGVLLPDTIGIRIPPTDRLIGPLKSCGADSNEILEFTNDASFAYRLVAKGQQKGIQIVGVDDPVLDHGALVPLYYIHKTLDSLPPIISVNISLASLKTHFEWGTFFNNMALKDPRRIVFIASADLSHCVSEKAPLPFNPEGEQYDKDITTYLREGATDSVLFTDPFLSDEVHACGIRSIATILGACPSDDFSYTELSYEAPYGVGHLTAEFIEN